ncbi:hypothetical protein [Campylobacter sp.]|uniref:hypothetical protein n=1 Tax=Campylobacter sp. TaxID=205 RepID=UPI0025B9259E|nr:hypothetical protein [Campylobacter sp.]
MSFLEELRSIKKELQKEQDTTTKKKSEIKSSSSEIDVKKISLKSEENKQEKEFEDIFLKEERLVNEFIDFVKSSDIKKIK